MENKFELSDEEIGEYDPRADILIEMSDYADRHAEFNANFLDSVRRHYDKYGTMSKNQYNLLVKIYNSCEMGKGRQ